MTRPSSRLSARLSVLLGMLGTLAMIAVLAGDRPDATGLLLAAATLAVTAALVVRLAVVIGDRVLTVGSRAHEHRESLTRMAEPRHPATAGLPLTRAPSAGSTTA
jgi:hypothetical protein